MHQTGRRGQTLRLARRDARIVAGITLALLAAGGCTQRPVISVIRLVDHRAPGSTERLRETFQEAWYNLDRHGNVDLVLRRSSHPGAGAENALTQVVHIRSVWRPIPGRTVTHRTQINGTITYYLVSGRTGTAYDGAGSVFFKEKRGGRLIGAIEHAKLHPTRHLASSSPLFTRAEISGEFAAVHDPRRVIQLVNEMNRLFGPPPPYQGVFKNSFSEPRP